MIIAYYDSDYEDVSNQQEDEVEYLLNNCCYDFIQREEMLQRLSIMTTEEASILIQKLRESQLPVFTHRDGMRTDRFLNPIEVIESRI